MRFAATAFFSLIVLLVVFQTPVQAAEEDTDLIAKVNEYRRSKGLAPVKTNPQTCNFALLRAKEVSSSFNHDGFYNRISSKTLPYHRYRLITENLAWAPKGRDAVLMWINSPSHAENMLKKINFACVKKYGDYYAFEGLQI